MQRFFSSLQKHASDLSTQLHWLQASIQSLSLFFLVCSWGLISPCNSPWYMSIKTMCLSKCNLDFSCELREIPVLCCNLSLSLQQQLSRVIKGCIVEIFTLKASASWQMHPYNPADKLPSAWKLEVDNYLSSSLKQKARLLPKYCDRNHLVMRIHTRRVNQRDFILITILDAISWNISV